MILLPIHFFFIVVFVLTNKKYDSNYILNLKTINFFKIISVIWFISLFIISNLHLDKFSIFLGANNYFDLDFIDVKQKLFKLGVYSLLGILTLLLLYFTSIKFKIKGYYLRSYFILFYLHMLIFLITYSYHTRFNISFEDNILEWMTFGLAMIASICFFIRGMFGSLFVILLSFAFFLFAMEEISWGQRVFNIENPDFFLEHNYQKELNVHNFFNPIIGYLYFPINLISLCFLTWFRQVKFLSRIYNIGGFMNFIKLSDKYGFWIVPAFLMFAGFYPGPEFVEEQWALFGFIISLISLKDIKNGYKL